MGTRTFIVFALLVLVVGVVGLITYEPCGPPHRHRLNRQTAHDRVRTATTTHHRQRHRQRWRQTPRTQVREQPSTGKKRSYFKVLVNLDEHENAEAALQEWPEEVERLRRAGRVKRADWLAGK